MGNSVEGEASEATSELQLQGLVLYEEVVSEQFGPIRILKQSQKPYHFIMLYCQNSIAEPRAVEKMQHKLRWYQGLKQHPHLVDIQRVSFQIRPQMCIKKAVLELHCRYYNHTLEMAIMRKLSRNRRFKEEDVTYVLKSLLDIWKHISDCLEGKYLSLFSLRNVFLSPEGFVKMYPFPIDLDFVSSPLKPRKRTVPGFAHQGEEVEVEVSPRKAQRTSEVRQQTYRDSLRDIGLVLFQLVLLNKESQVEEFSSQKQLQLLEGLQAQGLLSAPLRSLIGCLLVSFREMSYQQICSRLQQAHQQGLRCSACIRLEDGPQFSDNKEIEKSQRLKLLSEHKNLRAGMITILSKRSHDDA